MSAVMRDLIATAANTVPGVNASPYFRQTTKAGDGYVRLDRINRDSTGFGFINVWQVLVILPQDLENAEKWLDTHIPLLTTALSEELVVTTVTFQQLALDTGLIPVVIVEGNRAS